MNHEFTPVVEKHETTKLAAVHAGMKVYDSTRENIGEVNFVYLGAASQDELDRGEGPAREQPVNNSSNSSFIDRLAVAFSTEEMPTEVVERLRRHGYIRIDSNGLFAGDRYATTEQIASIAGNDVYLNVAYEDLVTPK